VLKSCFVFGIGITKMSAISKQTIGRRSAAGNVWLSYYAADEEYLALLPANDIKYDVRPSEDKKR